jgi:hypothetical protein
MLGILFDGTFNEYLSDKPQSVFAWTVNHNNSGLSQDAIQHFVNAETGEIIGYWYPCPVCE